MTVYIKEIAPNTAVKVKNMFHEAFTSHDSTGSGTKHIFTLKKLPYTFIAAHPQSSVDRLLSEDKVCLGKSLPYQECWHKMGKQTLSFLPTNQDNSLQLLHIIISGRISNFFSTNCPQQMAP